MDLAKSVSIIQSRLMVSEQGTYLAQATTNPQYLEYTTKDGVAIKKYIVNTNLTTRNRVDKYVKGIEAWQDEGTPIEGNRLRKLTNRCSLNYSIYDLSEHMPTAGEVFICHVSNVGTKEAPELRITKIEENKPKEPDTVENSIDIGESIKSEPQEAAQ